MDSEGSVKWRSGQNLAKRTASNKFWEPQESRARSLPFYKQANMREWRNRQTRTFEGRVGQLVRVQVPSLAPKLSSQKVAELFFYLIF